MLLGTILNKSHRGTMWQATDAPGDCYVTHGLHANQSLTMAMPLSMYSQGKMLSLAVFKIMILFSFIRSSQGVFW
jgi:hypothetical protein